MTVTPVMSSMLLITGTTSLIHAVPFHLRNCPLVAEVIVTSPIASSVAGVKDAA